MNFKFKIGEYVKSKYVGEIKIRIALGEQIKNMMYYVLMIIVHGHIMKMKYYMADMICHQKD
jgi:hypothetical protein